MKPCFGLGVLNLLHIFRTPLYKNTSGGLILKTQHLLLEFVRKSTHLRCVKRVRIRNYSGLYFPTFGLNTEREPLSLCIQSECVKKRTRITTNMGTFYVVLMSQRLTFHQYQINKEKSRERDKETERERKREREVVLHWWEI